MAEWFIAPMWNVGSILMDRGFKSRSFRIQIQLKILKV